MARWQKKNSKKEIRLTGHLFTLGHHRAEDLTGGGGGGSGESKVRSWGKVKERALYIHSMDYSDH